MTDKSLWLDSSSAQGRAQKNNRLNGAAQGPCYYFFYLRDNAMKRFHKSKYKGVNHVNMIERYIYDIDRIVNESVSNVIETQLAFIDKNINTYQIANNSTSYIYQESTNDGFFEKTKQFVKNIFHKIILAFKSIINKISSFFLNKPKKGRNVDSIVDEVITNNPGNTRKNKTLLGLGGVALVTALGAMGYTTVRTIKNRKHVSIQIPSDSQSELIKDDVTIDLPVDDINIKRTENDIEIFVYNSLGNSTTPKEVPKSRKLSKVSHNGRKPVMFINLIKDKSLREDLKYIITECMKSIDGADIDVSIARKKLDEIISEDPYKRANKILGGPKSIDDLSHPEKFDFIVTKNEIIETQKFLNNITMYFSDANSFDKLSKVSEDVVKLFNDVSIYVMQLQYSANCLSDYVNDDKRFISANRLESFDDPKTLGEFVISCINSGMPPKYVAYNTWLAAGRSIRGIGPKFKPVWGFTRAIFFPPNADCIYKIALSGAGMMGIKTESMICEYIKRDGGKDLVAEVINHYNDGIMSVEKVKTNRTISDDVIKTLETSLNDFLSKHNIDVFDINENNVGINKNNKPVIIDYGNASVIAKKE